MDEDSNNNPDRLLAEPPNPPNQLHEGSGSMSLGAAANGDSEISPVNDQSATSTDGPPAQVDPNAKAVHDVVNSEVWLWFTRWRKI